MAFNIVLYKTTAENNRLDKTLTDAITLSGTLREQCSIIAPDVLIETSTNISMYNYCYIAEFGRYYFIKNITSIRQGLWRISLKCDVLMTYNSQIKTLECIVDRSSSNYNALIHDPEFMLQSNTRIRTKTFGYTFQPSSNTYVLTVVSTYYSA